MNEQAVVMSIKERKAVVLAKGGQFFQIRNKDFHVGQRITLEPSLFSLTDRISFSFEHTKEFSRRMMNRLRYRGMVIIASIAILIPSSAYAATKYVPWTYVSLDTGAVSIQYQLNARGEILSTETLNDEGKAIIDTLEPIPFEKIEDAVDRTLNVIYPDSFQRDDQTEPMLIGISSRFGNGEDTAKSLEDKLKPNQPDSITFEHLGWSEVREAHSEEMSIGQYGQRRSQPDENMLPKMNGNPEHGTDPQMMEDILPQDITTKPENPQGNQEHQLPDAEKEGNITGIDSKPEANDLPFDNQNNSRSESTDNPGQISPEGEPFIPTKEVSENQTEPGKSPTIDTTIPRGQNIPETNTIPERQQQSIPQFEQQNTGKDFVPTWEPGRDFQTGPIPPDTNLQPMQNREQTPSNREDPGGPSGEGRPGR